MIRGKIGKISEVRDVPKFKHLIKSKPTIVGEANPYGGDPYYAMFPSPEGSSGWRLCVEILEMSRRKYLDAFERVNLCHRDWCMSDAVTRANELRSSGGKLILLGSKVCRAFRVSYSPFTRVGNVLILPHPSGRNRIWNLEGTSQRARDLVKSMLVD